MKKVLCVVSVIVMCLSLFCACQKEPAEAPEKETEKTTASTGTTRPTTTFKLGSEAKTSSFKSKGGKDVFHRDENNNDLMVEHYDADGKLNFYEKPVYASDGGLEKTEYLTKDKKLVASFSPDGHFYDKNNKEISENEFVILLTKNGIN